MDKTRLIFDNATEIAGNKEIGILSLTDLDKTRQLSIVCERNVALEIDKRKSPEPVNDNLLPEVLVKLLTKNTNSIFEILITDLPTLPMPPMPPLLLLSRRITSKNAPSIKMVVRI